MKGAIQEWDLSWTGNCQKLAALKQFATSLLTHFMAIEYCKHQSFTFAAQVQDEPGGTVA